MMTMSVRRFAGKARNDNFRPELPNDTYKVAKNPLASPFFEPFFRRLRKPEFVQRREELLGMIEAASGEQLFRADDTEGLKEFRTQEVLAAVASRRGEIRGADALPTGKPGQQGAVFVIGMSAGVEDAADHVETFQSLGQTHGSTVFGHLRAGSNHGRRRC